MENEGSKLHIFDFKSRECLSVTIGHKGPTSNIGCSFDSRYVISSIRRNNFSIWDMVANEEVPIFQIYGELSND